MIVETRRDESVYQIERVLYRAISIGFCLRNENVEARCSPVHGNALLFALPLYSPCVDPD